MAQPLVSFRITEVGPPRVGELVPSRVMAEVVIETRGMRGDVRSGWDDLRQHDVLFLLTGKPEVNELGQKVPCEIGHVVVVRW